MKAPRTAVLLLSLVPSGGRAQAIEITPVAGYRIGGGNVNTNALGDFEAGDGFELESSFSFGLHLAWRLGDHTELELLYARQNTTRHDDEVGRIPTHDFGIETWQAGAAWSFRGGYSRVRPFAAVALGLTRLLPELSSLTNETHFSYSLGGGVRLRLAERVRLRLETRWFAAVLGSDNDGFPGPASAGPGTSQLLSQLDFRAGLSLLL